MLVALVVDAAEVGDPYWFFLVYKLTLLVVMASRW